MATEPFFLRGARGGRFCVARGPSAGERPLAGVLFVPPFGEEMNKSRRVVAEQSRALAREAFFVLQIDLYGTGDSDGDFSEATWEAWLEDIQDAIAWLKSRVSGPVWLWGLRTGCLLAATSIAAAGEPANLVLWQPTLSGRQFLRQFLRMRLAGEWMASRGGDGGTEALRARLLAGETLDIAGYPLGPSIARGLDAAILVAPPSQSTVVWLEVSQGEDASLSPASQAPIEAWKNAGCRVLTAAVAGQPFWSTVEIAECPSLVERTTRALVNSAGQVAA